MSEGLLDTHEEGCWADLKKSWRDGKFKTWARYGGVANVIVTIFICVLFITSMPISGAIIIAIASLVGILELPFCCTSLTVCKQIQPYMATFETYWIRGLLYIVLGLLIFVVTGVLSGVLGYIFGCTFVIDGGLYILAHIRGLFSRLPQPCATSSGSWEVTLFSVSWADAQRVHVTPHGQNF